MTLGILGGLGPAAGAWFYSRLISLTEAEADSAHINVLLSGYAETPDRTAYLLGKSRESPLPTLVREAKKLALAGADVLVLLCHTAHAFLPELRAALRIPLLDMPYIALAAAAERGMRHIGILSTEGSYAAGVFRYAADALGLRISYPTKQERTEISRIIYRVIKCGKADPCVAKHQISARLAEKGAEGILLGCTELSMLCPPVLRTPSAAFYSPPYIAAPWLYIDPIEILARRCIRLCGKICKEEEDAFR